MGSRYEDNQSPEPSLKIEQNCFQTPDITSFTHLNTNDIGCLYPTPPSDSDEPYFTNHTQLSSSYNISPNSTDQYYHDSFSNHSKSSGYSPLDLAKNLYGAQDTSYSPQPSTQEATSKAETPQNPSSSRFKRRSRTTYSKAQLDILEQSFQESHYPEIKTVDDLCDLLKLSTERISIWFQNRRARFKKARKLQAQNSGYATAPSSKKVEKTPIVDSTPAADFQTTNKYFYDNDNINSYQNIYQNQSSTFSNYLPIKIDEAKQNISENSENINQSTSYTHNSYMNNNFGIFQPNFNHQYYSHQNAYYQGNYLMPYSYQSNSS